MGVPQRGYHPLLPLLGHQVRRVDVPLHARRRPAPFPLVPSLCPPPERHRPVHQHAVRRPQLRRSRHDPRSAEPHHHRAMDLASLPPSMACSEPRPLRRAARLGRGVAIWHRRHYRRVPAEHGSGLTGEAWRKGRCDWRVRPPVVRRRWASTRCGDWRPRLRRGLTLDRGVAVRHARHPGVRGVAHRDGVPCPGGRGCRDGLGAELVGHAAVRLLLPRRQLERSLGSAVAPDHQSESMLGAAGMWPRLAHVRGRAAEYTGLGWVTVLHYCSLCASARLSSPKG